MAEAALAVVRRSIEAFQAADPDTALRLYDPEVVWYPAEDEPETAPLHGREGVQGLLLQWASSFESLEFEVLEYIDRGDCVIVPQRFTGRMRDSGADVAIEETHVFWVRGGRIVEVREFRTLEEGLAAAELRSSEE